MYRQILGMPLHVAKFINKESHKGMVNSQSRLIKTQLNPEGKLTVSLASPHLVFIYASEAEFTKDWKIESTEGVGGDDIAIVGGCFTDEKDQ